MCEAWYFGHKWGDTVQNFIKTESFLDQEKLRGILWTFVKYCEIVYPTFVHFHESCRNSANIRQHLTIFPRDFNNIYLKYFGILQNLTKNYEILRKFTRVNESYNTPQYFLGQITHFSFHFVKLRSTIGISWFCTVTNEILLFDIVPFCL